VSVHRDRLDRALLAGADPVTTPELTLRAFQLTRPPSRAALAASLEGAIATAEVRRRRSPAAAPLARQAIAAARPELEALASALREDAVVAPRGVLLARLLLSDGSGPLYADYGPRRLRDATGDTLAALSERV
jgi:hypothetical protein